MPGPFDSGIEAVVSRHSIGKAWFALLKDNGQTASYSHGDAQGVLRALRIGSLSKSVTAIGIALLIQDGKLGLQTRLGDILPQYLAAKGHQLDPSLASLDIEHILAHRGGLRTNRTSDKVNGLSSASVVAGMSADAHFSEYMFRSHTDRSDGTSEFRYSNLSYVLLGMVIEAVSGQPYEVFCRDRIFAPLAITGTIPPDLRAAAPFSGWEMTAPDLLRLWTVFDVNHPTLLSRATLDATLLSRALPPIAADSTVRYTTATYVRQSNDRANYVLNHNGIMDFLRGQPNVYSYAEKYVPGYAWIFVYETPAGNQSTDIRPIVREVRALVESVEGQQ